MVSIPTWKWSEIGKGKRSEIYIRSMNSRIYVKLCMWIIGIDSYSVYLVASKFNISFVHVDGLPRQQIYNRYWFLLRTNLLDPNSPRGSSGLKNELVHISAVLSVIGCKLIPLLTKNVNPYWVDLNPWTSIGETWSYWVMRRKEVCKHEYWLHRTRAERFFRLDLLERFNLKWNPMTIPVPNIETLYVKYGINSHVKMIWNRKGEKIRNLHKINEF